MAFARKDNHQMGNESIYHPRNLTLSPNFLVDRSDNKHIWDGGGPFDMTSLSHKSILFFSSVISFIQADLCFAERIVVRDESSTRCTAGRGVDTGDLPMRIRTKKGNVAK